MDYGIQDRVALVTASSKGLGKVCALGLAREGVRVALCARDETVLQQTTNETVEAAGTQVFWQWSDMSSAEDILELVATTRARFGKIDILVTNAGGPPPGSFLDFTDED